MASSLAFQLLILWPPIVRLLQKKAQNHERQQLYFFLTPFTDVWWCRYVSFAVLRQGRGIRIVFHVVNDRAKIRHVCTVHKKTILSHPIHLHQPSTSLSIAAFLPSLALSELSSVSSVSPRSALAVIIYRICFARRKLGGLVDFPIWIISRCSA